MLTIVTFVISRSYFNQDRIKQHARNRMNIMQLLFSLKYPLLIHSKDSENIISIDSYTYKFIQNWLFESQREAPLAFLIKAKTKTWNFKDQLYKLNAPE